MDHIEQFRVLNPHPRPFIKRDDNQINVLPFQNFTQGEFKSKAHA